MYVQQTVAEQSGYEVVWLKSLAEELQSEQPGEYHDIVSFADNLMTIEGVLRLTSDMIDRLLIARLELDPQSMT